LKGDLNLFNRGLKLLGNLKGGESKFGELIEGPLGFGRQFGGLTWVTGRRFLS